MSAPGRRTRGFTLLEAMVASAISLVLLAGGVSAGLYLQRRALLEEQTLAAQNSARSARELLVTELQRAGTGMGSARLFFGGQGAAADVRYAIDLEEAAAFDGSGLFAADADFAPPPAAYAGRASDAFQLWGLDWEQAGGRVHSLGACGGTPSLLLQGGDTLCPLEDASALSGRLAMVVKPETRTGCVVRVTAASTSPLRLTVAAGLPDSDAPAAGEPCAPDSNFWLPGGRGAFVLPLRGVAFRINWRSGTPELQRLVVDSTLPAAAVEPEWVTLSREVEQVQLQLGVSANLQVAAADVVWFPDAEAGRPAIADCDDATCGPLVPDALVADGGTSSWAPSPLEPTARDALMRRVRRVRLLVVARSPRADQEAVQRVGSAFALDEEGLPRDGFKRRAFTVELNPRNFAYAGVVAP